MNTYKTTINGKELTSGNLVDHYNIIKDNTQDLQLNIARCITALSVHVREAFYFDDNTPERSNDLRHEIGQADILESEYDIYHIANNKHWETRLIKDVDRILTKEENNDLLKSVLKELWFTPSDKYTFEKVA